MRARNELRSYSSLLTVSDRISGFLIQLLRVAHDLGFIDPLGPMLLRHFFDRHRQRLFSVAEELDEVFDDLRREPLFLLFRFSRIKLDDDMRHAFPLFIIPSKEGVYGRNQSRRSPTSSPAALSLSSAPTSRSASRRRRPGASTSRRAPPRSRRSQARAESGRSSARSCRSPRA